MTARRRLAIAHVVLAIVSSFAMWTGTELPLPIGRAAGLYGSFSMVLYSLFGWAPYVISWFYARSRLQDSRRAVLAFTAGATICAMAAILFNRNSFGFQHRPASIVVAAGLTLTLITLARLCSTISRARPQADP